MTDNGGTVPRTGKVESRQPGSPGWRMAERIAKIVIVLAVIVFFSVLIFKNVAPYGARVEYTIIFGEGGKGQPAPLTPSTALGNGEDGSFYELPEVKMTTDLVTFDLETPYDDLDTAEVSIRYKGNPSELLMGVTEKPDKPYLYKPVHNRSLNDLPWDVVAEGPLTLFQKSVDYASIGEFIAQPPLPAPGEPDYVRVAEYYYEIPQPMPDIDTSRTDAGTRVAVPLRGAHSFYIYIDGTGEVALNKVELNRSEGPDPLEIVLYRDTQPVWATNIPDDGEESANGVMSASTETGFVLEGLEAGVYRVDLVCDDDVLIEDLASAQGYVSFIDKVSIADSELYGLAPSQPVIVYSNAQELNVYTDHPEAFQVLTAEDGSTLVVDEVDRSKLWFFQPGLHEIRMDAGGLTLASKGSCFAFTQEAFFDPFPLKVEEYSETLLLTDIAYIVGEYSIPSEDGDWLTRDLYFDLRGMEIEDGRLRFSLLSPALQQKGGQIVLGSITISLKEGDGG